MGLKSLITSRWITKPRSSWAQEEQTVRTNLQRLFYDVKEAFKAWIQSLAKQKIFKYGHH